MIFNLRGTNGSGKSWVVHQLLRKYPHKDLGDGYFIPKLKLSIVGRYDKPIGGCDLIHSTEEIQSLVDRYAQQGNVLFEGVIVSTVFESWQRWGHGRVIWVFADTPLSVCVDRIQKRNQGAPIKTKLVENKYRMVAGVKRKMLYAGEIVETLNHLNPVNGFLALLKRYGADTPRPEPEEKA